MNECQSPKVLARRALGKQFTTGTSEGECCFGTRLGILEDGINDAQPRLNSTRRKFDKRPKAAIFCNDTGSKLRQMLQREVLRAKYCLGV